MNETDFLAGVIQQLEQLCDFLATVNGLDRRLDRLEQRVDRLDHFDTEALDDGWDEPISLDGP